MWTGYRCRCVIISSILISYMMTFASAQENSQRHFHHDAIHQMREQYTLAEQALQEGKLPQARHALNTLLEIAESNGVEPRAYIEVAIRLVSVMHSLKEYDEEQALLEKLFEMSPSEDLLLRISMLQGRLYHDQSDVNKAYVVLNALDKKIPQMQWHAEDRALYHSIKESLNQRYQKLILSAERLFDAGLYAESTPLYQEVIEASEQGAYPEALKSSGNELPILPQLRYRLIQAHYLAENYEEVIASVLHNRSFPLITKPTPKLQFLKNNELFLLALSYRQAKRYEEAIETFRSYLQQTDKPVLQHYDQVQYELGLSHFMLGRYTQARSYLKVLSPASTKNNLYARAQLCLARIDINQGDFKNAEKILQALAPQLKGNDDLNFELVYLQGETCFKSEDYVKAVEFFEKAIPKRNQERAEWCPDTLYHLGWSCLKIANNPVVGPTTQTRYFDKAEDAFKKLILISSNNTSFAERGNLALAQTYLWKGCQLNDPTATQQAQQLLSQEYAFKSIDAKAQALMLRAEITASYAQRNDLYQQLTSDHFLSSLLYHQGWYLRGINHFEEGQRLIDNNDNDNAIKAFMEAIPCFQKAFELLQDSDKMRAALALKYEAQAYQQQGTPEKLLQGLSLLENLIKQHHDLLLALAEPGEIFYLRGQIVVKLAEILNDDSFYEIAEQSMFQVITNFSGGQYTEPALHFLGTIYFQQGNYSQAQHMFNKLAADYPNSCNAGDAIFWAGECADWLQQDRQIIQNYRRQVFKHYPNSQYASEAFFTYYSYSDYLQGEPEAIKHLQMMKELFPKSPFLINAYYLIGLDYKRDKNNNEGKLVRHKELNTSIEAFEQVKNTFDKLFDEDLIPSASMEYFVTVRYRAALEAALTNLLIAEESTGAKRQIYLEYAENNFDAILQDFADDQHPLIKFLKATDFYASIKEEAQYGLTQVFIRSKNDSAAEKILTQMLETYSAGKINRGYLLSRIWYDLGCISMRRNDNELALQFFHHAEDAAKGRILSAEQKLDLWIQQSLCHRAINQLDEAMVILSKVINDDTISTLRLKAMYLRAEIYEQQGRTELAIKQLEATAKKGGPWASEAKEKLVRDYGFR